MSRTLQERQQITISISFPSTDRAIATLQKCLRTTKLGLIEPDLFERSVSPSANRIAPLSDGHQKANMAHTLDEVRRSLAEGYLSEAALQLQELLSQENNDIRNELIVISADISRTERFGRMNLTPQHELLRMKNAQTKSLLDFIDSLQTELI